MTETQILQFIAEHNTPAPITWGDFKKLLVLELLFMCDKTKIPADTETVSIYTKLTEKDLKTTIDSLIREGIVSLIPNVMMEGGILKLNYTAEENAEPTIEKEICQIEAQVNGQNS